MSDVFVSYARSSNEQATRVHRALQEAGYEVWRDSELPAHRAYSDVIEERLRSARAVVVIWSGEAARSHWVRAEADRALQQGTLVQASVDGTGPPIPFNQIQCADLTNWVGEAHHSGWRKLVDSVAALAGERVREALLQKPSIAVLPFRMLGEVGARAFLAEALPHELIAEFARLRWVHVIARGSSFQFREAEPDLERVRTVLGARYCLSGTLEVDDVTAGISVELVDTRDGRLIWCERFSAAVASIQQVRHSIVASVVAALEIRVPAYEALQTTILGCSTCSASTKRITSLQVRCLSER
jgi:adenylate cyclase